MSVKTFEYATRTNGPLSLDLHHSGGGKRPLVIYLYGGGFEKGNREQVLKDPLIKHLCDNGFAVAVPDYRLNTNETDIPAEIAAQVNQIATRAQRNGLKMAQKLYGVRLYTACEDISEALQFCKSNSDKMKLNDGKIGMIGVSAGGLAGNALCYPPGGQWSHFNRPDVMVSLAAPIVHAWRLRAQGIPLWVIHGKRDRILPVADSLSAQEVAQNINAQQITIDMPVDAPHIGIIKYIMEKDHKKGLSWAESISAFLSQNQQT